MCPVLYVVQVCMYVCDRGQHKGWCSHVPCSLCSTGMYAIGVSIGGGHMCPVLYVVQVCMYVCDRGQHKGWCSHVP